MISGPSGSGKSTVVRELFKRLNLEFSVSATTRQSRPGEVEGVHYDFVSTGEFRGMIEAGSLLEWAIYNDNYYGTPAGPVDDALAGGRDILLEIEIQGARQIRAARPDAIMFFIVPPSMDELERRLRQRGDTSSADIRERLRIARGEMEEAPDLFDHIIVNDRLEEAVERIVDLLSD